MSRMAPRPSPAFAEQLQVQLLAWYGRHARRLPWRAPAGVRPDPWRVLVSEVMLQQTTAATVAARFDDFLARFPTPAAMAAAGEEAVLQAWSGLGYYRRARALHACARALVAEHGGRVPVNPTALSALPGLGPYTAAAVAAIAFDLPCVPVDGNVARVLVRLFALDWPLPSSLPRLRRLAATLAPSTRAGDFAQALMELGALVCRPRTPACCDCPLTGLCRAQREGRAAALPRRDPRRVRPRRRVTAWLAHTPAGLVLLRRRPPRGLLAGLVDLPSGPLRPEEPPAAPPLPARWRRLPGVVRHAFTHLELELVVELAVADVPVAPAAAPPDEGCFWWPLARLEALPLSSLGRRLLNHAGLLPSPGRQASAR